MVKISIQTTPEVAADTGAVSADMPLRGRIIHALKKVFDPELPVNVYDLGLIYGIHEAQGEVKIEMTLTAPNCPVADMIVQDVAAAVAGVEGVNKADVTLVWEPKWSKDRMSDAAKVELGWF